MFCVNYFCTGSNLNNVQYEQTSKIDKGKCVLRQSKRLQICIIFRTFVRLFPNHLYKNIYLEQNLTRILIHSAVLKLAFIVKFSRLHFESKGLAPRKNLFGKSLNDLAFFLSKQV